MISLIFIVWQIVVGMYYIYRTPRKSRLIMLEGKPKLESNGYLWYNIVSQKAGKPMKIHDDREREQICVAIADLIAVVRSSVYIEWQTLCH